MLLGFDECGICNLTKQTMKMNNIYSDKTLRKYLISVAYNVTGDINYSEDIVQDAFIKLLSLKIEINTPKAYLKKIVINKAIDYLKELKKMEAQTYQGIHLATPVEDDYWSLNKVKGHTLDMATFLLFNKLTPYERAIFVLRKVYKTKYDEIAEIFNESESYCRKIYSRLKPQLAKLTDRKDQSHPPSKKMIQQFIQRIEENDLAGLKKMFAQDIKYYVDSGGKIKGAAIRPVKGDDAVAKFILSRLKKITPQNTLNIIKSLNGLYGVMNIHEEKVRLTIHLKLTGNRISSLFIVSNPDKLMHLKV